MEIQPNEVILAIVGGRGFNDYALMERSLDDIQGRVRKVVSGDSKGADLLGRRWARERDIEYKAFLPDWGNHGKAAGPIRNELIIKEATHVVAFWDGESRGTKSSIDLARKYRRRLRIIRY